LELVPEKYRIVLFLNPITFVVEQLRDTALLGKHRRTNGAIYPDRLLPNQIRVLPWWRFAEATVKGCRALSPILNPSIGMRQLRRKAHLAGGALFRRIPSVRERDATISRLNTEMRKAEETNSRNHSLRRELQELRYYLGEQVEAARPIRNIVRDIAAVPQPKSGLLTFDTPEELISSVKKRIHPTDVVLDVGYGIRPMKFFRPKVHICAEPYYEYVNILQNIAINHPHIIVMHADALKTFSVLPDRSVDSIFLIDVIEHMQKEIGREVLRESERVARRQIIIFTPLGFMPQHYEAGDRDAWGLSGTAQQEHLSGWLPDDFADSWSFLLCPRYHVTDASGTPLAQPFGAFWAIWNRRTDRQHLPCRTMLLGRSLPPASPPSLVWEPMWGALQKIDPEGLICMTSPEYAEFSVHPQVRPTRLATHYRYLSFGDFPTKLPAEANWTAIAATLNAEIIERICARMRGDGCEALVVLTQTATEAAVAMSAGLEGRFAVLLVEPVSLGIEGSHWFKTYPRPDLVNVVGVYELAEKNSGLGQPTFGEHEDYLVTKLKDQLAATITKLNATSHGDLISVR
jgi:hypothetical protein